MCFFTSRPNNPYDHVCGILILIDAFIVYKMKKGGDRCKASESHHFKLILLLYELLHQKFPFQKFLITQYHY